MKDKMPPDYLWQAFLKIHADRKSNMRPYGWPPADKLSRSQTVQLRHKYSWFVAGWNYAHKKAESPDAR